MGLFRMTTGSWVPRPLVGVTIRWIITYSLVKEKGARGETGNGNENINELREKRRPGSSQYRSFFFFVQIANKVFISNCVAVPVRSRGISRLVWDYMTPNVTQTHFTIQPAPLRRKWPRFYCRGHDDSKGPVASIFRNKNNSNPKMMGAGFSETLETDYNTRCRIQAKPSQVKQSQAKLLTGGRRLARNASGRPPVF